MQTLPDAHPEIEAAAPVTHQRADRLPSLYQKIRASWQRIAFWAIMACAVFLRLYQFPGTPAGIWVDEVTEGYDAFALLQHGTDRWGNPFPLYFPGWGSGQNVLQAYLSIPFIKLFGLNIVSVRLVPLILGILSVYLLYMTVKKIYGTNTGLVASFLLATLPWSVMATRWGLESNLLPFFFLLGIFSLLYSYDSPRYRHWIPVSLVPLALAFYAYGLAIIPVPVFLLGFVFFNRKAIFKEKTRFVLSIIIFLLISAPFLLYVVENDVIHKPFHFLAHLPITIPYLSNNRLDEVNNGLSHVSLVVANLHFFIGGYHDWYLLNNVSWISPLGWLAPPFIALGVYFSLKRQKLTQNLFVFWLIATFPMFALIAFTVHHANALFIPLIVLGAYGIVSLLEAVQPISSQRIVALVLIGSLFAPNLVFYRYYFTTYNKDNATFFNAGYDQALAHALQASHPDEYVYIHMSDDWANYADTLFYLQSDAQDFYTHADIQLVNGVYQVYSYGRYYFGPYDPPATLTNAPSYIAILKGKYKVLCPNKEILYQDNRWPGAEWTVERCSSAAIP